VLTLASATAADSSPKTARSENNHLPLQLLFPKLTSTKISGEVILEGAPYSGRSALRSSIPAPRAHAPGSRGLWPRV